MYSSNQILDISVETQDLVQVLDFAIKLYDSTGMFTRQNGRVKMAFSEPISGVYAIGVGSMEPYSSGPNKGWSSPAPKGWTDYPFDYDPAIIAPIISQWVNRQPAPPEEMTDGTLRTGIRVRSLHSAIDELPALRDVQGWGKLACILCFTPVAVTYDK